MSGLGPPGPNNSGLNFSQAAAIRRGTGFAPTHPNQNNKPSPAPHNASPYQSHPYTSQQPTASPYSQQLFTQPQMNGNVPNGPSRSHGPHVSVPNGLGSRPRPPPPRQQMQTQPTPPSMIFPGSMGQHVQHDSLLSHQQQQHASHQGHPGHQGHQGHPQHTPHQTHQNPPHPGHHTQQQQQQQQQQQHQQQHQQHSQGQHHHHQAQAQPQTHQHQPPPPTQQQPHHQQHAQSQPQTQHPQHQQQQHHAQHPHHQQQQQQHYAQQQLQQPQHPQQVQAPQQQQGKGTPQQQHRQTPQQQQAQLQNQNQQNKQQQKQQAQSTPGSASQQLAQPPGSSTIQRQRSQASRTPQQQTETIPQQQPNGKQAEDMSMDGQEGEETPGTLDSKMLQDPNYINDGQPLGEMMSAPPEGGSYPTLEAVQKAVLRYCMSVGYAIVIGRSKKTVPGLKKVLFVCDRAGKPPSRVSPEFRKRKTSSRKCDCPFGFFAIEQRTQWTIRYRPDPNHLQHNHGPSDSPTHHPAARKLDSKMVAAVKQLKDNGAGVSETLQILQTENPDCHLLPRDIYNARAAINRNPAKVASGIAENKPAIYTKPNQSTEDRIRADLRRELAKAKEDLKKIEEEKQKEIDALKAKMAEKDEQIQKFEMFIDICNQRVMVQRERLSGSEGAAAAGRGPA